MPFFCCRGKYKGKVSERLFTVSPTKPASNNSKAAAAKKILPLTEMEFFIHKVADKANSDLKAKIQKLGGKVTSKFHDGVVAVVSIEGICQQV